MRRQRGFTLIELLVVIAIIGILATLVVTQLGTARVKARNASVQSDVSEAGKAIETFKNDDAHVDQVIATGAVAKTAITLTSGGTGGIQTYFTGATSGSFYAVKFGQTSGSSYTYKYTASGSAAGVVASGTAGVTTGSVASGTYSFCGNLVSGSADYFQVIDGVTSSGGTGGATTACP